MFDSAGNQLAIANSSGSTPMWLVADTGIVQTEMINYTTNYTVTVSDANFSYNQTSSSVMNGIMKLTSFSRGTARSAAGSTVSSSALFSPTRLIAQMEENLTSAIKNK